jgi:hypothetical protein
MSARAIDLLRHDQDVNVGKSRISLRKPHNGHLAVGSKLMMGVSGRTGIWG